MSDFDLRKFLAENKTQRVDEFVSTGRLVEHPKFKEIVYELRTLVKDSSLYDRLYNLLEEVGELGLDIGYSGRKDDASMLKVAEEKK